MEYVDKFKKTVEDKTEGRVKVYHTPDSRTHSYASGFRNAEGYQQTFVFQRAPAYLHSREYSTLKLP